MHKSPVLLLSPLVAACAIATVSAAPPAPDAAPATTSDHRADLRRHFFDTTDTNHDGVVSRAEYQAQVDARFDRFDSNHDGRVDADEIARSPAAARRAHQRAERFMRRYAGTGSTSIDKAAFEAKATARFDRLGGGADTLTEDQLAAHRRGHAHRPRSAQPGDAGPGGE